MADAEFCRPVNVSSPEPPFSASPPVVKDKDFGGSAGVGVVPGVVPGAGDGVPVAGVVVAAPPQAVNKAAMLAMANICAFLRFNGLLPPLTALPNCICLFITFSP